MVKKLFIIIFNAILVLTSKAQTTCSQQTFPSDRTDLTTPGEFITITSALTGRQDLSGISCLTSPIGGVYVYAQYKLGFDLTSTSAGNVCSVALGFLHGDFQKSGVFIYNSAGDFINAAGTTLNSGVGDSVPSTTYYYAGIQSIWLGVQTSSSSNTATAVTTQKSIYCYDAAYTNYCIWASGLTNAEATSDVSPT